MSWCRSSVTATDVMAMEGADNALLMRPEDLDEFSSSTRGSISSVAQYISSFFDSAASRHEEEDLLTTQTLHPKGMELPSVSPARATPIPSPPSFASPSRHYGGQTTTSSSTPNAIQSPPSAYNTDKGSSKIWGSVIRDKTRGLLKKFRNSEHSISTDHQTHHANPRRSISVDESCSQNDGWTVHVWSTWLQRPSLDGTFGENFNSLRNGREEEQLTEFQKAKLTCFHRCLLDRDKDGKVTLKDFNTLAEKIRRHMDWSPEHEEFAAVHDLHRELWEHFKEEPNPLNSLREQDMDFTLLNMRPHVSLSFWLEEWGRILQGMTRIIELPPWLQQLPKFFFRFINKRCNDRICVAELRDFYSNFLSVSPGNALSLAREAYLAMTGDGAYILTVDVFELTFANFLFGKVDVGPGRYLFPCCLSPSREPWKLDLTLPESPVKKVFDPLKDPDL
ncbi:unnamed protein product [Cyprideis torosa]|uniref:Uncharacterized protein n=1 Tax=Cyprideis torosa TaxID=163714 RepID=A0A7R8W506_9CRUS|nr:unnamed protein product [Cyprideis torosa]CAG0882384.1 unnamed protein product [Cyprideis torosa]